VGTSPVVDANHHIGTVTSLYIAAAKGAEMVQVDVVELDAGAGIRGDRYHGSTHRHVSVQAATALAEASVESGLAVTPAATRRNITLDAGPVPTTPDDRLVIGSCLLEVVRIAAPCKVMDDTIGQGARSALRRRGGVICRVLVGGAIEVGDEAFLVAPERTH
jgi:MOSC domain-containing protein YiiM